jgi:hypothetical protein
VVTLQKEKAELLNQTADLQSEISLLQSSSLSLQALVDDLNNRL